jgi:hypothetical protein
MPSAIARLTSDTARKFDKQDNGSSSTCSVCMQVPEAVQDVGIEVPLSDRRVTPQRAARIAGGRAAQLSVDVAYAEAVQDVGTELNSNAARDCQVDD